MCTPQSDGKRERLCFIERKDKSFVSNHRDFPRENILIFRSREGRNKNTGTFSRSAPCFSLAPPLSQGAFLLWGEIGSCFLAPLGVRSFSGPSGQCTLAHDALARGDAHPRLAHSASFTFLPSPITCNLLNYCSLGVKTFVFPLSAQEGEGSSPKPSPSKHCRSVICTHLVKR